MLKLFFTQHFISMGELLSGWQSEVASPKLRRKGMVELSSHPYLCMHNKAVGGWPQESCPLSPSQFSLVIMPLCSHDIRDKQWHTGDHGVKYSDKGLWHHRSFWRTVTIRRRQQLKRDLSLPCPLYIRYTLPKRSFATWQPVDNSKFKIKWAL